MKSFKQYLDEKSRCWTGYKPVKGKKPFSPGSCEKVSEESEQDHLGPEATKKNDKKSVDLQKKNLDRLTGEYNDKSKAEGGSGMAKAHADMFANTKKAIHSEEIVKEDGMGAGAVGSAGPTNTVGGIAGSGDSRLAPSQREPGVSKKRNPILKGLFRRKPPKA